MPARPSLRTVPADRRSQMEAIRRREDDSLVAASKSEAALRAAEERLAQLVASQRELIDDARAKVGAAYREVVDSFGSQSRAAEYLDITPSQLRATLAAATETPRAEVPRDETDGPVT